MHKNTILLHKHMLYYMTQAHKHTNLLYYIFVNRLKILVLVKRNRLFCQNIALVICTLYVL